MTDMLDTTSQNEAPKKGRATKAKTSGASTARKKNKRHVPEGIIYVQASFNNTIITITDNNGDVLCWETAGSSGYRGSRKSTPFAAQIALEKACEKAKAMHRMQAVRVVVSGPGPGRECIKLLGSRDLFKLLEIRDGTGIPHNGCRPKKKRRV